MHNDEFNKIEITNDKQVKVVEFGKTQQIEFTSQKDNSLPEGDLNEKVVGKTIRKKTEVNVEYTNKTPIHGSETVVSSSTTATTVGSAVASVATAASVVAVTAVAVGTGISVALHDYKYEFEYFEAFTDSVEFGLIIYDLKEERPDGEEYEEYDQPPEEYDEEEEPKAPFTIRIYNSYYDYSVSARLGYNDYYISSLEPNQQYHIVLSENRFGGETIFDETFATKEEQPVSEMRGVSWDKKANFLTNTMTVQLDYTDETDSFSDFKFILSHQEVSVDGSSELVYSLEKTTEEQEILLTSNPEFSYVGMYNYSFTYVDNGETKTIDSGEVYFEDNSGAVSEFREFIFDKTANFLERTFEVQLDFQDDFNYYSDFVLTFYYMEEGRISEYGIDVALEKTTEVQTIDLDGIEISLSQPYYYKLTCKYDGEEVVLDEDEVSFTDNSGAIVEFHELIFDKKVNFDTRTFEVTLDYQDDLGYLYGFQFTLEDLDTGEERTYYLLDQTETQTITVDEVKEYDDEGNPTYFIDVVEHRMSYSFKYWNQDQEITVVDGEEFKFKNSLVSTFQGIETAYDFYQETTDQSYILPIKFLYDDAAHIYQSFYVEIIYEDMDYAYLMFEGDTVTHNWMYGTVFNSFDGNYEQSNLVEASNVDIRITASMLNVDAEETGGPDIVDEVVYTEEDVTFTLNENQTIYSGIVMNENINNGSYEVAFMPIYTGAPDDYDAYVIFECFDGNIYTCPLSMPNIGSYTYVTLTDGVEDFDESEFWEEFANNPVKISIKFAKVIPGQTPDESDYTTMVVYESYQFEVSA